MDALGIVQRIGNGELIEDLATALAAVAADVVESGKDGSVTLTLKVSTRHAGNELVTVEDSISRKPPKRAGRGAMLYALDGELYARDPRQTEMQFRTVAGEAAEVRETTDGTAVREA